MKIQQHIDDLTAAARSLEQENERLQQSIRDNSTAAWKASDLERKVNDLNSRIEKLHKENQQLRMNVYHWRCAVRYEQALKRARKIVRHLPIYNEIQRAKRRDAQPKYLGYRTNPERVFLKRWRKENKRITGMNGGRGTLEIILSEDNNYATDLSQRDATVAATVIQWLGTNCGRCFVEMCEKEIKTSIDRERKEIAGAA